MNLLEETNLILKEHGKTLDDITFVQGAEFGIPIDVFIKLADTEYYAGYGAIHVAEDLIVGGNDWWIERHEYDGSEWWEYKTYPRMQSIISKEINALTVDQSTSNIHISDDISLAKINDIHI